GKISARELTNALADILPHVAATKTDADTGALSNLVASLQSAGEMATFQLEADEALERVEDLVNSSRIGASDPKPGHIHLTGYSRLIWSDRPYTFFVGLDGANFPGGGRQDPVLLDSERRRLHSGLPLGTDKPLQNQYMMRLALATRRGEVTLGFSSHDIVQNRPVFPSPLLLEAGRFLKEDSTLDYTALVKMLGEPFGYSPGDGVPPLDELEWWLNRALGEPGLDDSLGGIKTSYRNINRGVAARVERGKIKATEYDGWIPLEGEHFDPRINKGLVLSSSRIEELAGCPFSYFLRYVLQIQPPEDLEYDPDSWLDAMQRGALLHDLFYKFMKVVAEKKERPDFSRHYDLISGIARNLIEVYRENIPPPSDLVFERESKDIHRCCELFLRCEEAETESNPSYFEIPFGLGSEAVEEAGYGLVDPLKIDLDGNTYFTLRGKIDRIDSLQDGTYSVLDYKTGGAGRYNDNKYLDRGRQIQHALYSVVAEKIIGEFAPGEKPWVKLSGYYFPTERGEGRKVLRIQTDRDELKRALNNLFDLLGNGFFIAAEDRYKCTFCDYRTVCGYPHSADKTRLLIDEDSKAVCTPLRAWKELMIIG
ncbi:MAG TPA: PD-(D/E)XK nuclease family protein, partial [Clostridia bacterium]|nr:PD-(D/E)XK nuclease family protein [Clostridia bacterium]